MYMLSEFVYVESVRIKNSVKTHKFLNLCDFTEFLAHCVVSAAKTGMQETD